MASALANSKIAETSLIARPILSLSLTALNADTEIIAKIAIIDMTTRSSSSVKPKSCRKIELFFSDDSKDIRLLPRKDIVEPTGIRIRRAGAANA